VPRQADRPGGTAHRLEGGSPPARGEPLDPGVQQRLLSAAVRAPAAPPDGGETDLTPRESDVLRLIAAGRSNREIARALFVSEATVKTHINRIFAKTGSRDRMQAMRYAYTHGFADPASQAAPRPDAPR
jgi:DNA-binding NarL/FixJ family response regulator